MSEWMRLAAGELPREKQGVLFERFLRWTRRPPDSSQLHPGQDESFTHVRDDLR
jgi:hypothetical protein